MTMSKILLIIMSRWWKECKTSSLINKLFRWIKYKTKILNRLAYLLSKLIKINHLLNKIKIMVEEDIIMVVVDIIMVVVIMVVVEVITVVNIMDFLKDCLEDSLDNLIIIMILLKLIIIDIMVVLSISYLDSLVINHQYIWKIDNLNNRLENNRNQTMIRDRMHRTWIKKHKDILIED